MNSSKYNMSRWREVCNKGIVINTSPLPQRTHEKLTYHFPKVNYKTRNKPWHHL